ncbi:hypothetical protein [Clostridium estertheticum]|uniref:hypothetical protein n=1 Tax=Clostridium estertheticum TaxID=238834 RepID=UPI001C0E374C|nr:hypothetical protein [Clostridium estertheticum]MBU3173258.1 hypothetical protein [Clostridium estertheticum]
MSIHHILIVLGVIDLMMGAYHIIRAIGAEKESGNRLINEIFAFVYLVTAILILK